MVLCDHHQANEERELSQILGRGVSLSRGDLCVFLSCGHLCPVGVFPYLSPCPVAVFVSVSRGVSVSLCPLSVCVPVPWGLSLSSWGLSPCPGASACLAGSLRVSVSLRGSREPAALCRFCTFRGHQVS